MFDWELHSINNPWPQRVRERTLCVYHDHAFVFLFADIFQTEIRNTRRLGFGQTDAYAVEPRRYMGGFWFYLFYEITCHKVKLILLKCLAIYLTVFTLYHWLILYLLLFYFCITVWTVHELRHVNKLELHCKAYHLKVHELKLTHIQELACPCWLDSVD